MRHPYWLCQQGREPAGPGLRPLQHGSSREGGEGEWGGGEGGGGLGGEAVDAEPVFTLSLQQNW